MFDLKRGWLVPHAYNDEPSPGRTIHPEPMRMAEPGWVQRNWSASERVVGRESDVDDDQLRAAREWLDHLNAGRLS